MSRKNLANAAADKFGAEKLASMNVDDFKAAVKSTIRDADRRVDLVRLTEALVALEHPHLPPAAVAQLAAARLAP